MSRYLLDTNVISHLIRDPHGRVAEQISKVGEANIAASIVAIAEIRFGLLKKPSKTLTAQAEPVLAAISVMPFAHPAEERYAEVRVQLERTGRLIGNNDLLIAAHALALGSTLVTDNIREFARVNGLQVENWLR